jgi:hypothetical protein
MGAVSRYRNSTKIAKIFMLSESMGIIGSVDSSIVRNSKYLENTTFRKADLCPSSGEGRDISILLWACVTSSQPNNRRLTAVNKIRVPNTAAKRFKS